MMVSGDIIFMSDQDDIWFDEKIENVVKVMEENPKIQVLINDAIITDSRLNKAGHTKMDQIKSMGDDMRSMVMGTCTAIRKDFLIQCLPLPYEFNGHDDWIHFLAKEFKIRKVLEKPLQYYRIHSSNTSKNIANTITKINFWKFTLKRVFQKNNIKNKFFQKMNYNDALLSRIDNFDQNFFEEHSISKTNIKHRLNNENKILIERIRIHESNFFYRLKEASKILIKGDYSNFSGIKSYIRDILAS